jgi:uncharacterized protein (DUF934 family)
MRIIRDRQIVADDWTLIPAGESGAPVTLPASGKLIVPLRLWQARREELLSRASGQNAPLGVWLDSNEDAAVLAVDLHRLAVIAVNFPRFADGRGYSTAFLLRSRYGYQGELRAIGDVLRDQLFYLQRVGFNAFALRADRDVGDALQALKDFSETYQASVDQPVPLFRRRAEFLERAK